ncbi:hypothetical protein VCCP103710_2815 [Vibrio cholerae CP1037(10)]|nr:hypothetical protein VCCP103710_2815 [Vibrio cholerae CP1037(10)]
MCILHHQMWVELFARLSCMDKAKALSLASTAQPISGSS